MARGKPWTPSEVSTVVESYLTMLDLEVAGEKYSKAAYRRLGLLTVDRSNGSWEMKCCNISAVLNDHGLRYIQGYKPLKGYQRSLVDAVKSARPEWFTVAA